VNSNKERDYKFNFNFNLMFKRTNSLHSNGKFVTVHKKDKKSHQPHLRHFANQV